MEESSIPVGIPGWAWALIFMFVVGFVVALVFLRPIGSRRHRSSRHSGGGHHRSRGSGGHSRRHRGGRTSSDPFDKY